MDIFEDDGAKDEKKLFDENGCEDLFISTTKFCTDRTIPEACKGPLKSMSMYSFEGAFAKACECDDTGSTSRLCDKYCGQCPCKKNVAGRKCNRCAPGFFGFGADGCQGKHELHLLIYSCTCNMRPFAAIVHYFEIHLFQLVIVMLLVLKINFAMKEMASATVMIMPMGEGVMNVNQDFGISQIVNLVSSVH